MFKLTAHKVVCGDRARHGHVCESRLCSTQAQAEVWRGALNVMEMDRVAAAEVGKLWSSACCVCAASAD